MRVLQAASAVAAAAVVEFQSEKSRCLAAVSEVTRERVYLTAEGPTSVRRARLMPRR